jgi:Tuberculosis necrotizing toxin
VRKGGQFAYRLWGGGTPQRGKFLAPNLPASKAEAISTLALPPKNTAENLSTVYLPEGTQIQSGNAAKAFGQPGGGKQIQLLQEIPDGWFGPGMPFWSK